jgi:2-polyprenyl-6-methoxyphenol hydroxylase-like FAD-dependent oxidoreductase
MSNDRTHAIVIGGGIGGLLVAVAVSRHFGRVTVLESDTQQMSPAIRKGVPQGGQAHILLTSGQKAMADLIPGLFDDLADARAVALDFGRDVCVNYGGDGYKIRYTSNIITHFQTRPLLEWHIRERVKRYANIRICHDSRAVGLSGSPQRVTGTLVKSPNADVRCLDADLVIAACGRGHQVLRWLTSLGCEVPGEKTLDLRLGYATQLVESTPRSRPPWGGLFIIPRRPDQTRAGYVLPVENGRWQTMLAGYLGDYPPCDRSEYIEYARQLLVPDIYEFMKNSAPCSEIESHRFKSQRRLYFEDLPHPPDGFIVIGDSWASMDPLFGQGMSIVAKQAQLLSHLFSVNRFTPRRYYQQGASIYRGPWMLSLAEDLRYPLGDPVDWKFRLLHMYMDRIQILTRTSAPVYDMYLQVANLEKDPLLLFHPRILWKAMTLWKHEAGPQRNKQTQGCG